MLLVVLGIIYIFKLKKDLKKSEEELENHKNLERTFEQMTFIELEEKIEDKKNELSDFEKQRQKIIDDNQKLHENKKKEITKIESEQDSLIDKNQKLEKEKRRKEEELNELKDAIDILK